MRCLAVPMPRRAGSSDRGACAADAGSDAGRFPASSSPEARPAKRPGPHSAMNLLPRDPIMPIDSERRASVQEQLKKADVDAFVCGLPAHVLLLTGYWPVVGTSLAIVVRDGPTVVLAPEDEEELAKHGGADKIYTYKPAPLDTLETLIEAQSPPLADLAQKLSSPAQAHRLRAWRLVRGIFVCGDAPLSVEHGGNARTHLRSSPPDRRR